MLQVKLDSDLSVLLVANSSVRLTRRMKERRKASTVAAQREIDLPNIRCLHHSRFPRLKTCGSLLPANITFSCLTYTLTAWTQHLFFHKNHLTYQLAMSSWTTSEDKYRLPEGMVRTGYDADKQRYQFHDRQDGSLWEGPEGSHYGKLRRGKSPVVYAVVHGVDQTHVVSTSMLGGPNAKMFDDSRVNPEVFKIARKSVKSTASPASATSPVPKDFDQILGNLGHERRASETDVRTKDELASGVAILGSAMKRSASVVCSPSY